jgi:hypothetical protein
MYNPPTIPATRYYTEQEVAAMLATVRYRSWIIWGWSMLITVMIAASMRKQLFVPLPWYVVPMISVPTHALCFWLGMLIYFRAPRSKSNLTR